MRTTLSIDDDILATAKQLATRQQKSVCDVISALARRGLSRRARASRAARNGIPLLSSRKAAAPVAIELVNQLRDEQP